MRDMPLLEPEINESGMPSNLLIEDSDLESDDESK